ncbi:ABC transporter substrate-binding protein [Falsigemmobacter intermedius]|uniref:ABC transporter substrate-binding protein n=1 Tax=Falsigemmobacter intermedius TaxID=1553448 RepID=UPI003F03CEA3
MPTTSSLRLSRRQILMGAAAALALPALPFSAGPGFASGRTKVTMTLPWVANGSNYFPMMADRLGISEKHGIDLEVARGFGSVAAAQAVANSQFDFGLVFASGTMIAQARGLDLVILATLYYDATMGTAVLANSPITAPKDLEGKKLGTVPTSAESPFFNTFSDKAGIAKEKVELVQVDSKIIERALIDGQVDAITAVGSSSIPVIAAQGVDLRFMLWSKEGVELYAAQIVTRREIYENDKALCQKVVDTTLECFAHSLREPEASLEMFAELVPEVGLTKNGMETARISQGISHLVTLWPEAIENALGYSDLAKMPAMYQSILDLGTIENPQLPPVETLVTNEFIGNVKLSAEEWEKVRENNATYAKFFG